MAVPSRRLLQKQGWLALEKNILALDAGCGVGGSSYYLAQTFGCQVKVIDLTPEYAETSEHFNNLCGLEDKISVSQGNVSEIPKDNESFDLVWRQNVTMNVGDKGGMFAEAY